MYYELKIITFTVYNFCEFSLSFHCCFLLNVTMISSIGDIFRVLFNTKCFGIISNLQRNYCSIISCLKLKFLILKFSHLCQFAFCLLKISMVLHIRLNLCVLCDTLRFRCLSYCGSFCFRNMPENQEKKLKTSDQN